MRSFVSSLSREIVVCCRWLAGGCGHEFRGIPAVNANRFRPLGRSFVTAMAGLAIVLSLVALTSPAAVSAEEAVAEAAATAAATADVGVTAAGYKPNLMSVEQMVEKLWTGADTVWVLICSMLVFFMNLGFGCV